MAWGQVSPEVWVHNPRSPGAPTSHLDSFSNSLSHAHPSTLAALATQGYSVDLKDSNEGGK